MKFHSVIILSENPKISEYELTNILRNSSHISEIDISKLNSFIISSELNSIGIKETAEIARWSSLKTDFIKFVIIYSAEKLTREAQNSLLKIIEEPPDNTLIVLITVNCETLLETILSRCITIKLANKQEKNENIETLTEKFFTSNYIERLKIIDNISEEENNREICQSLILGLIKKMYYVKKELGKINFLKKCYVSIKHGSNIKLTLEAINLEI
jgi:DNA polymerase III delta prime subunit